jgi:hypothetical protein
MGQLTHTTAEVDEQLDGVFAEIYTDGGSTAQSIAQGVTPVKVINFLTNGDSDHCTADQANSKITVTLNGEYYISISCSYKAGTGGDTWFGSIFADGVELSDIHFEDSLPNNTDFIAASASGLHHFTGSPCDVDFRIHHDDPSNPVDFTATYMNLTLFRIGI